MSAIVGVAVAVHGQCVIRGSGVVAGIENEDEKGKNVLDGRSARGTAMPAQGLEVLTQSQAQRLCVNVTLRSHAPAMQRKIVDLVLER